MKKLTLTNWSTFDYESKNRLIIYGFDDEDEKYEVEEMLFHGKDYEVESMLELYSEYNVAPGALYCYYYFDIVGDFLVVTENVAYNI